MYVYELENQSRPENFWSTSYTLKTLFTRISFVLNYEEGLQEASNYTMQATKKSNRTLQWSFHSVALTRRASLLDLKYYKPVCKILRRTLVQNLNSVVDALLNANVI